MSGESESDSAACPILGQTPGDRSRILISKKVADNDLAPTMLHETVHLMGYGEFGAHAAEFAAGYLSAEELWSALQSDRGQKYILQINPTKDFGGWICAKYFTNSGQFWGKKEELLRDMFNYGSQIIGTRK